MISLKWTTNLGCLMREQNYGVCVIIMVFVPNAGWLFSWVVEQTNDLHAGFAYVYAWFFFFKADYR